jgi:hypothetical protein
MTTAIAVVVGVSLLGVAMTVVRLASRSRTRRAVERPDSDLAGVTDPAPVLCEIG